uniref:Ribonuclease H-like domain-containing protein n=1 Tax=Tanacetum cinerariifolium TaxID=118510 RepID=A0A6L2KDE9_TANCI|nr:ribonuclease H-like domain-containing protein [Tanacetum cinerariifolium]
MTFEVVEHLGDDYIKYAITAFFNALDAVPMPLEENSGEYTRWSIRMEPYLTNTDYGLWQVIMNGDEHVQTTRDENGVETEVPLKTTQAILARQRERKAKSILLLAIPNEYQLRFHTIKDAKSLWAAIKSRFGGNVESKKMQKTVLKQQFENFYVSDTKGLYKAYDRNKEGIDELDINNLYNNLKVFEADIKGHSSSRKASSSSYNDDLMFSFFSSQLNSPQLDDEDIEQIDHDDLEEIDLKWQNTYEEKIAVLEFEVKDKSNAITRLTNYLDQTLKEKEDLKAKLEQFEISSKNLNKLINSQLSAKDKTGLGYGDQLSESDSEVLPSVFDSRSSDGDDNLTNDRYKKGDGYHAVFPPLTGNYMPPLADLSFTGLDDYVYRPTVNKASASISKGEPSVIKTSNISVEMSKVDSMRTSGVIIEDWVSDDEDTLVDTQADSQTTVKRSFKKIKFTKARNEPVKSDKQADKPKMVTQNSKADKKDWNGNLTQKPSILKETVNTVRINGVNTAGQTSVSTVEGNGVTAVKTLAGCVWRPKITNLNNVSKDSSGSWISKRVKLIDPQGRLNGCSRHMTGNKALLTDYQDIDGGFVAFGGSTKGGKITEHSVLFTESECLVLSPDYKLIDESQVLLRVPRQTNMYNFDLKNVVLSRDLTCLFTKATINESNLWHRRLGHVNFKTMNKLVKGNLVRGLPSKTFENDHTCVACRKGKQHKASCKAKLVSSINQPLQMLHIDLFGLTFVRSINHKTYCLVVTDDFSSYKSSNDKAGDNTADDAAGKEKVQEPVINTASASRTFIPPHDPLMPELEDTAKIQTTSIFGNAYDEDDLETNNHSYADKSVGAEADFNNMEPSTVITQALNDESWFKAMQEELLQFKIQKVWTLVDLPYGKKAIGTKWVYQNKKDKRGIIVRNKARLVAQGHKQEEGIDYDKVFALVVRVEAIRLFLAFASYMNFPVYQMDVKSAFLYGTMKRSDYAGARLDRKSTPGGCQFLGSRLISWQCKKHIVMMDFRYNFMQIKIHVDNESAICVIKNHVYHSKTKHIKIRHHFIRDSYEKRLIEMVKIHTDNNVADLLIKAFDVGDEAVHKELGDRIERAATTASSLEAEQDSEFCDKHNMVAYLEKSEGSEGFHQIIDFLSASHIKYALTKNPTIYASLIEQFWQTAALSTIEDGVMAITATINRNVKDGEPSTPESSPSRITSSPSLSPQHTSINAPSTSQPPNIQTTPVAEETTPMPHDSPLQSVHTLGRDEGSLSLNELTLMYTSLSTKVQSLENELQQKKKVYSSALTKLILRVKKLERTVNTSKARRKARIVISKDEDAEAPSKQGRSLIEELDMDVDISLVPPHVADQGRKSYDTQVSGQREDQLGVFSAAKVLADAVVQGRSARDKELERFNAEQEAIDIVRKEKVVSEGDQAHDIDWSDPAVIRYHTLQNRPRSVAEVRKSMCIYLKNQGGFKLSHFKGMSYEDIRPLFEKVWDQIHSFVPMNSELGGQRLKRTVQEVERQFTEEEKGKKSDDSSKPTRKKTLARKREGGNDSQESVKKQKLEDDTEKKELKAYLDIVSEDEIVMEVESLATKYPIIDWKTHVLTEHFMYYQIIRADGSSKNYKIFSKMLDDFDRQDVMDLHRLVEERYTTTSPEGYDLMLWDDLKTLFEPDKENELWKNQFEYNLISWRLCDSSGIHILLMYNGITIHMLIEKKYPLGQEMKSNMLNKRLEVEQESEMAFELLRIEDQDFDALPSEEGIVSFLRELDYTGVINSLNDGMYYQKNIDYVELLWEDFIYQIEYRGYKKQEKIYYPRFTKVIIHHFLIQDKTLSWRNKIRMHTSKDDYLINTLRYVSRKEASQKYRVVLPECLTSHQIKESKAYKTYLGYATGTVPPKVAKKFKKASPSKKDSVPIPADEEPVQKGKKVKKSSTTLTIGIVIREPHVETQLKRKEKVDVAHGKGTDMLSEIALTEEAQMKDVRKKILRDFHKSHPSGSGSVAKKPPSVEKITPPVTSKGTGDKPGVPDVTKDESTKSESESWDSEQDTDGSESDSESNQQDDDDDDEIEDDDDEEKENLEINQEQVVEDAHVTITKKTEVHVTSSSRSFDLASKFLNFSDIPPADAKIVSPLYVHVHHEVPRIHTSTLLAVPVFVIPEASLVYTNIPQSSQTFTSLTLQSTPSPLPTTKTTNIPPSILDFTSVFRFNDRVIALEKDVAGLKNDPLQTQVTALVDGHLDTRMGSTREEFMNFLSASLIDRIIKQVRNQLPQILPEEVSNFAPPMIKKMIQESLNQVILAKESSQPQSTYEAATTLTEFELKKILINKINSKFEVGDTDTPQGQENQGNDNVEPRTESASRHDWFTKPSLSQKPTDLGWNEGKTPQKGPTQNWLKILAASTHTSLKIKNPTQEILLEPAFRLLKGTRSNYVELEYDFEECYKALLEKIDWENLEGSDYPFDLYKLFPLITHGNHQSVLVEFFINNISSIEDMVSNIWSPVKVAYDKYALWGISHWRDQRKTFYTYARGIQSRGDVYSTKRILVVTHVSLMRKHGYGYLEDIVVRRADNKLYKFKEDDVADFAIALRMFTRSLVIQNRVVDLQLGVKSYQKQINITKLDTTRPELSLSPAVLNT